MKLSKAQDLMQAGHLLKPRVPHGHQAVLQERCLPAARASQGCSQPAARLVWDSLLVVDREICKLIYTSVPRTG